MSVITSIDSSSNWRMVGAPSYNLIWIHTSFLFILLFFPRTYYTIQLSWAQMWMTLSPCLYIIYMYFNFMGYRNNSYSETNSEKCANFYICWILIVILPDYCPKHYLQLFVLCNIFLYSKIKETYGNNYWRKKHPRGSEYSSRLFLFKIRPKCI